MLFTPANAKQDLNCFGERGEAHLGNLRHHFRVESIIMMQHEDQDPNINAFTDIPIARAEGSLSMADLHAAEPNEHAAVMETILDSSHTTENLPDFTTASSLRRRRGDKAWGCVLLAVAAVLVLGVALGITGAVHEDDQSVGIDRSNVASVDAIVDYLSSYDVSRFDVMTTEGTAQYAAVQWLTKEDPAALPVPKDEAAKSEHYLYQALFLLLHSYVMNSSITC